MPKIAIAYTDDYEAIYIDGELKLESSTITLEELLELLDITPELVRINFHILEKNGNHFPKELIEAQKLEQESEEYEETEEYLNDEDDED